jgi:DNA-binding LytR/AlgR family response regulator
MSRSTKYLNYVFAGMQNGVNSIPVDAVIYFRTDDQCTRVITSTGEHRISTPLSELLALLDPEKFRQVHRFMVVNRDWISTIRRENNDHMVLTFKGREECCTVDLPYSRVFLEN